MHILRRESAGSQHYLLWVRQNRAVRDDRALLNIEEDHVKRSRALIALLPIALVGSLLTACSSGDAGAPIGNTECMAEGSVSKSIKVDGDLGSDALVLATDTPVVAEKAERSILIHGDGKALKEGDTINATYTIFSGSTGENLASELGVFQLDENVSIPWVLESFGCTSLGDRIVTVAPLLTLFDESFAQMLGVESDDTLMVVFDLMGYYENDAATGEPEQSCEELTPRDSKYPEVELGDGTTEPQITIPECMEPPSDLEIKVLVEGDGPVVEADQNIMTNYVGVDWNGAVRFDGNWSETGIRFSTAEGALISGFTQAMVGQKIGSTILVTMPSELGYQDGMTRTFVLQLVSVAE